MTLQELRYLVALADKGHFVRAAESCNVGQPTLSTQLKKLEDYLGVTLFERNKHHLRPTPIGEQIIERARLALEVVEQIKRPGARRATIPMNGPLRLGVIPTLGPYLIPHLLPAHPRRLSAAAPAAARGPHRQPAGAPAPGPARCPAAGAAGARRRHRECWRCSTRPSWWRCPTGHALAAAAAHHRGRPRCTRTCCCSRKATACATRRSPSAAASPRTSARSSRPPASRRCGRWSRPASAARCCRCWPRSPGVGLGARTAWCRSARLRSPQPTRTIGLVWRHGYPREATVKGLAKLILANLPPAVEPVSVDDHLKKTKSNHTKLNRVDGAGRTRPALGLQGGAAARRASLAG